MCRTHVHNITKRNINTYTVRANLKAASFANKPYNYSRMHFSCLAANELVLFLICSGFSAVVCCWRLVFQFGLSRSENSNREHLAVH